tara:strand:- start:592 stop:2034 length:1443 start_codon:yes stop_codon:yes gene_type:complete
MKDKRREIIKKYFNSKKYQRKKWLSKARTFHKEDLIVLRELIPENSKILELGCGNGHLLAGLKPKKGVGLDLSKNLIEEAKKDHPNLRFFEADIENIPDIVAKSGPFDFILLCDTVGYLEDIQKALEKIHLLFNKNTRLIISYYSPLWTPLLYLAAILRLKLHNKNAALLNPSDIKNFLKLSSFETVRVERKILVPFKLFGLERIINRFFSTIPIFSSLCLRHYNISRSLNSNVVKKFTSASIIIPCKNEFGNIRKAVDKIPRFTNDIEIIFVEGHSHDGSWEEINKVIKEKSKTKRGFSFQALKQPKKGKADAVFFAFEKAKKEILIILDGDLTVSPEELNKFWKEICNSKAEYVNGSRLVYSMDDKAMRFLNHIANRIFSILFTWLLGQRFSDTLCGTKVISKENFLRSKKRNKDLGNFDPFGDFFLIFAASRLSLKISEVPIRYRARTYGETQISRFSHGFLLIKMFIFAFFRLKAL